MFLSMLVLPLPGCKGMSIPARQLICLPFLAYLLPTECV